MFMVSLCVARLACVSQLCKACCTRCAPETYPDDVALHSVTPVLLPIPYFCFSLDGYEVLHNEAPLQAEAQQASSQELVLSLCPCHLGRQGLELHTVIRRWKSAKPAASREPGVKAIARLVQKPLCLCHGLARPESAHGYQILKAAQAHGLSLASAIAGQHPKLSGFA